MLVGGFKVLVFQDEQTWVAQCLEVDIVGFGKTPERALENLCCSLAAQAQLDQEAAREAFEGFDPAPEVYQKQFELVSRQQPPRRIEPPPTDLLAGAPPPWTIFALENEAFVR